MDLPLDPAKLSRDRRQIYWVVRGRFGLAVVSVFKRSLVPHAHAQFQALIKLGGEDITVRRSDSVEAVTDDRIVILNPWESHAVLKSKRGSSAILALEIEADWLASLIGSHPENIQRCFPTPTIRLTPELLARAAELSATVCDGLSATADRCEEIMAGLLSAMLRESNSAESRSFPAFRMIDRRIRRAVELLTNRACENPNLTDVARQVGMSRSHFFQQFKNCVGVSPQHFLDWHRMEIASERLTTEMSVSEIADSLGFAAPSHFTRFFVQHFGLPPNDFRRSMISVSAAS